VISKRAQIGDNVCICEGVVIEDNVVIGDHSYLDYGCIVRKNVILGANSYVGPYSVLGEYTIKFHQNRDAYIENNPLQIGANAVIRSHAVIYSDSKIGDYFQTGHHVTVREKTVAGHHLRIGTLSDLQGYCEIGDYVSMHSNVHISMASKIGNYVWIFPYCVFTNDPIPPSEIEKGCTIEDYCIIATKSTLLPGVTIGKNAFVGAGSIVTQDVPPNMIALGVPAKLKGDISQIKNPITNKSAYPWPPRFDRNMPWKDCGFDAWKE
jgi:acetyltransferase-like isoleucine patch superfamily enzyme